MCMRGDGGDGIHAVLLDGCCPLSSRLHPSWGGAGSRGWWLFYLRIGALISLTCALCSLKSLQGSVPDIKYGTVINICHWELL